MTCYETLSLIVNAVIAVGTVGAASVALYISNKNIKTLKSEDCTVEAEYASFSQQYGYRTGYQGDMQNSAIQVSVYNNGMRDFYIQSIFVNIGNEYYTFPKSMFNGQNRFFDKDEKVLSGYRIPLHIEFKMLIEDSNFKNFYKQHCLGKDVKIGIQTVFKNIFYATVPAKDFSLIEEHIRRFAMPHGQR